MPFVFHCVFFSFLNLQKNVPPPAPVMANGKKPYERQFGPGQRKSAEPMNLLIIEKEDEPLNSKSYNSMGSTSRGSNRDHRSPVDTTGRLGYQRNGIIPNGPVTHPVTLVGTLTNNSASVSRDLSPLLEDDSNSMSTTKEGVFLGQNKTSSLERQNIKIQTQDSTGHVPILLNSMKNQSTSYSKDGMTIRSNPLDNPFPSEDIIQNVDNDARLIQNDLSSDKSESKVQNISRINPVTNRKANYDNDEIPQVLYRSHKKIHKVDNRRHSDDHHNKQGNRPTSISSVHNIPPESMNPQIKKFIDRVGCDPEIEDNENSDTKPLNTSQLDQNYQTKSDRSELTKENRNQVASSIATSVSDDKIPPNYSPKTIQEPLYAKVNKDKTRTKIINTEEPTKAKIESIEKPKPQNAQIIPKQKDSESTEKVTQPRSPNSLEFHRRMQKILEKQEMEKQRRSPRREKKSDQSPSPRFERPALFHQHEQKTPSPQPLQQQELNQQYMIQQHMQAKQMHVENMQSLRSYSPQAQSKIQLSGMKHHSASNLPEHTFPMTSDTSPNSTDTGIYAKINPRKSPVLHKPQPVTYCKHCGSGHVTTVVPDLPVSIPEPVSNKPPARSKENTFQSIDAIPSPLPTSSEAFTAQYSWSDTSGTMVTAGTASTTISPTIASSEQFAQISSKPPLAPSVSKMNQGIDQIGGAALPLPPSAAVARGKIAVTTAALLKQMHEQQLKVMQAQANGGSQGGASGAGFDPSVALQQILLKQAVAHHHGRDVRRFSNPKVVYLGPDMEVTASKVSIYDNVQYVWKDDHDPH